MIEICLVNSSFNIIAMILMILYVIKLHLASEFKLIETILYFILAMMCALRVTTDLEYLYKPIKEEYVVLFPLIRNYLILWVLHNYYNLKIKKYK